MTLPLTVGTHTEGNGTGTQRENGCEPRGPSCLYCQGDHWGEACEVFNTIEKRRQFFHEKKLCYNCGRESHGANYCRSRPCFKCKSKHHTSLCDRPSLNGPIDGTVHRIQPWLRRSIVTSHHSAEDSRSCLVGLLGHGLWKKLRFERSNQEAESEAETT